MDMSKYREMFLVEAKEHLSRLESLALDLERRPTDRGGIDAVFREAHSIKGMAASMGYRHTTLLAHHLEDQLDGCRKTGVVPPHVIHRLLAGTDLLTDLLEDLEAGRPERDIERFLGASSPGLGEERGTPDGEEDALLPLIAIDDPEESSLQVTVRFAADSIAPVARAMLVLREIAERGRILSSAPEEKELVPGMQFSTLTVRVETAVPPEQLRSALETMSDVERVTVGVPPQPEYTYRPRQDDALRSVRVSTELLDRFINLTGELITNRYIMQSALRQGRTGELRTRLDEQARLIDDLHHQVLRVRLLSFETVTARLPRLVRELSRKLGKEVTLRLEGQEVELDRAILEVIADPVLHLVRNAVDHGIESRGEVSVRAWRDKDQVVLEIGDDGRGMDPELIRAKGVEKGVITPSQALEMSDRDVLHLVCAPGFSTAAEITETSGRGVGLDVVRMAVTSLGGTFEIDTVLGQGTRFRLRLPLSVAIVHLLLIECAGHLLGVPFSRVSRVTEVPSEELRVSGRQSLIRLQGEDVPLLSMRKLMHLPQEEPPASLPVVVTEVNGRSMGLVVDRLAGQRQAFIKSLSFPLDRLPGVSGATILGDGSVVFVIDPPALLGGGNRRPGRHHEESHAFFPADGRAA